MSMKDVQNEIIRHGQTNDFKSTIFFVNPEQEYLNAEMRGVIIEKMFSEVPDMAANSPCFCGSGKKQKHCHPDIHPNSLAAQLLRVFHKLDTEISRIDSTMCHSGCSDCCTNDFEISLAEFMMIFRTINLEVKKEQIESLIEVAEQGKFHLGEQCVLLNPDNNSCSVYKVRPIICRKYGYYKNVTDCEKIQNNSSAFDSLLTSNFDTDENINIFHNNGKIFYSQKRTIVYWLSKCDSDGFTVEKLNKLYFACFNRPLNDYIRIIKL